MGERQSGGGLSGRGSRHTLLDCDVEALLIASLIRDGVDAEAEQRAVAAFRAARDAGALRTRGHRRDDWRSGERRHLGRSLKTTLSVLFASLTLGGVAVAAIGAAGSPEKGTTHAPGRKPAPSSAPHDPAGKPPRGGHSPGSGTGSAPARPGRPSPAQDDEVRCRAYERAGGRGEAMDATAWQRLVTAAGGERNVTAYCAGQSTEPKGGSGGSGNGDPDRGGGSSTAGDGGAVQPDNAGSGESGNGTGQNRSDPKRSQPKGRHQ
ncbi:hypothetical protein [Streptomyces sp. NPDC092370]|uniref:hypothetical protein n=1 Tax=Streptomyces sp. NPDC092370 TaxID=3366016 RepID=UPI0037F6F468